jgi:hypothetical protein
MRKPIQISRDAILPTPPEPWADAARRLDDVEAAIKLMDAARDRATFEDAWHKGVDALELFWSRFETEGSSKFKSWAHGKNGSRRKDPLLSYLIFARHQSQHGGRSLLWSDPVLQIAPGFNGYIQSVVILTDGTYEMEAKSLDTSGPEPVIAMVGGTASLAPIQSQKPEKLIPVPTHFGPQRLIVPRPTSVLRLALGYYRDLLDYARQRFAGGGSTIR